MIKLFRVNGEVIDNAAQAVKSSQLGGQHGDEVRPPGKISRFDLGGMPAAQCLELMSRQNSKNLGQ